MDIISLADARLLQAIAGADMKFPIFVKLAMFCAKNLIYILPCHLIFMWLTGTKEIRREAAIIFFAIAIALICSYLIGFFFDRQRPFVIGLVEPLLSHRNSPSFPSNHALIFAIYCYSLYRFNYFIMFIIALIFTLLTCWARIYTGIHYPFDILGGFLLGYAIAAISINYLMRYIPNWLLSILPCNKGDLNS